MTINQLILSLYQYQKEGKGNHEVLFSSDNEGNTVWHSPKDFEVQELKNKLVIFPSHEVYQ